MVMTRLLLALLLPPQTPPADTAVLRIGTRVITVFRSPGTSPTLQARIAAVTRRVKGALATGEDSVAARATLDGMLIVVGGDPVFLITPADVDTAAGESTAAAAQRAITQLRLAVRDAREAHSAQALLHDALLFVGATALLLLALWLLLRTRRRALTAFEPRLVAATQRIGSRGFVAAERLLIGATVWVLGLGLGYLYLAYVLKLFPWTRAWGETLGTVLVTTGARVGASMLAALPNLAILITIFLVTRFLRHLVRAFFDAVRVGRIVLPGFHPDTAEPSRRIVVVMLWMIALVIAYPYVPGSGSVAFKGISVITGVLFTLGSAGLVGQAMSGLVLMYSRSFRVGDFIQTGGIQGTVVELGLLSTRLRTPKNEFVTLPNNVVVSGAVTDYTAAARHGSALLIYSSVTIGYDTPWRRVHELLIAAAVGTDGVLKEPAPFVLQNGLDDSYVEYQLNAAVDAEQAAELPWIYGRMHAAIQDSFWAAGVEIMSPMYHAVRDGNTVTIPVEHRPKQRAPAFRVDVNPSP
jgi:small-conductance mechanosensitive channel